MKWNIDITPFWAKVILWAALGVVAVVMFRMWLSERDADRATESALEQNVRTGQAASGIVEDASAAETETQRVEVVVTNGRDNYQRGYEDAKRNDPQLASWADRPWPERLRVLACERRLARERSGCTGSGCPSNLEDARACGGAEAR